MFLQLFGSKWKEKFLILPGNIIITEYDKYAVAVKKRKITDGYVPRKISKLLLFS